MSLHQEIPYAQINKPVPKPVIKPMDAPTCEAIQRAPLWHFALAGAGIGALIVLYLVGVL